MNIRSILQQVRYFFLTVDTQILINVPIIVGFCCFGSLVFTGPKYTGLPSQKILIMLGFLCWAISGIPKILRQESVYGPVRFDGLLAIIDGIVSITLFLFLASMIIIFWSR
jgi:hypothetical protein